MDSGSVILAAAPVAIFAAMVIVCRIERRWSARKLERLYRLPSRR